MAVEDFFDESTEQSQIKSDIVAKYFWSWAKVIRSKKSSHRIAYIDLFAGPGRYKDGSSSTPLKVLKQTISDPDFSQTLVTIFNDFDQNNVQSLQEAIASLDGIQKLKYQPVVFNKEVGQEVVKLFEQLAGVPTLFFVDPWGYKGLSLQLINSVLKNWGSDCIFFFNYNRINMGLQNDIVQTHMNALFGENQAAELRKQTNDLLPAEREIHIVEAISQALKKMGGEYVLPFRFRNAKGTRTSHHLIFVSKHPRGYQMMKDIMAKESSSFNQGVATFEYNPATRNYPLLFELKSPLDDLGADLLKQFKSQSLTVEQIFERHNIGKPFVLKNYKDILKRLEAEDKVKVDPPADRRPKRKGEVTLADQTKIIFPE